MRILLLLFLLIFNLYSLDRGLRKVFETEPKIALLIGNSNYSKSNHFDSLKNPENDIRAISKKLKKLGFKVIEGYNLTDIELQEKVDQFLSLLKSNRDGVGLFYFAGHGIEVNGINYLIPSDISVNDMKYIPYRSTPLNPIIEQMNETGKRVNIAILDACRENPFKSTRNSKVGGLASFSASGTFIAYSAESGKLASDGKGKLSPFAEAFIKEVERPQTIERLFKNIRVDVFEKTDGEQTPATYSLIKGDFYFKLPKGDFSTSPNGYGRNDSPTVTSSKVERSQKNRVYISPTPKNARVRILNIKPKYFDGIDLETDKALIEVTADGYKKYLKWHYNLKDEAVISIELEKERVQEQEKIVKETSSYKIYKDVFVDKSTNLMWTKNSSSNSMNWNPAKSYCEDLRVDGYSDWRLPTRDEAKSLLTYSYGTWDNNDKWRNWFDNNKNRRYNERFTKEEISQFIPKYIWTSTKYNSSDSWIVDFDSGLDSWNYHGNYKFVLCVRDFSTSSK